MKRLGAVGSAVVVTAIALWAWPDGAPSSSNGADSRVIVERVSDGDTIRVHLDQESVRVRIIGLDAPEIHTSQDCGGHESLTHLQSLVAPGDEVVLVSDPSQNERDRYDRVLAHVELANGTDIGKAQITAGWARVYRHGSRFDRFDAYEQAERDARNSGAGIWSLC